MARKYRNPFLKEVITRLDYSYPITQLSRTLPNRLKDIVSPLFQISEPKAFIGREFQITRDATKEKTVEGTNWLFHSTDRKKTLTISRDNTNISYKTFDSFDVLKSDFLPIVDELFNTYDEFQGRRLGLRYINEIALSENNVLDWSAYLDERLLSSLVFTDDPDKICRAFNDLELNYGDSILKFQYGIFNPDYPAPIQKKSFILDYDAYYQGSQNREDIAPNLEKFNEAIHRMFENSISDKLRDIMGVENNG